MRRIKGARHLTAQIGHFQGAHARRPGDKNNPRRAAPSIKPRGRLSCGRIAEMKLLAGIDIESDLSRVCKSGAALRPNAPTAARNAIPAGRARRNFAVHDRRRLAPRLESGKLRASAGRLGRYWRRFRVAGGSLRNPRRSMFSGGAHRSLADTLCAQKGAAEPRAVTDGYERCSFV